MQYSPEEDLLYILISTFDENDDLIGVTMGTGYPIRYENGFDVNIDIDGNTVLLSELLNGSKEDCFVGALVFGIFRWLKLWRLWSQLRK